ncbi:MAG: DUF2188 domain-containing protein [Microthrixaceae bacterium]
MAKPKPVHVTPRPDGDWSVQREGGERASSIHDTQAQAEAEGRRLARQDETEFLLHGRDGRIRARDSYGNDPYPPKG